MMIETGQAAIIRTPVTLKLIVLGCPVIVPVHGGKNISQPLKESSQKAVIKLNWNRL